MKKKHVKSHTTIFRDQIETLITLKGPLVMKLLCKESHLSFKCSFSVQILNKYLRRDYIKIARFQLFKLKL